MSEGKSGIAMSANARTDEAEPRIARSRNRWDIALGVVPVIGALIVPGHAVLATLASVLGLGWLSLIAGLVSTVGALFGIGTMRCTPAWCPAASR
jgi:uncharacterized membrane protein HdeD (DUF308 family)